MITALERLSKINSLNDLRSCVDKLRMGELITAIQEVVAIAKANQQPSIDAMRFEASMAAMSAFISNPKYSKADEKSIITASANAADALIAELQKTKI